MNRSRPDSPTEPRHHERTGVDLAINLAIDLARLREERLRRWHLAGNPLAGTAEAAAFFYHTGFCFSHRARTFLLPSFIEAIAGAKHGVPAYADAAGGHPLYARYVMFRRDREIRKLVLEAPLIHRRHTHVVRDLVPDFARLLAEPSVPDRRAADSRAAARRVLKSVANEGPMSRRALRLLLTRGPRRVNPGALDRVLLDLESRLRLLTVDYTEKEGAFYDLFTRAHRSLAERAAGRSRTQSLDRIVERYVRSALLVEPARVWEVLRGIASADEIRESLLRLIRSGRLAHARASGSEWIVATKVRWATPRLATLPC